MYDVSHLNEFTRPKYANGSFSKEDIKAQEKAWAERYRYFSHPLQNKIGEQECDGFPAIKRKFEQSKKAGQEGPDPVFRMRPTGFAKHLMAQQTTPITQETINDHNYEATIKRVNESILESEKKTEHQNYPLWRKYKWWNGTFNGTNRFSSWYGAAETDNADIVNIWFQKRREARQSGTNSGTYGTFHPTTLTQSVSSPDLVKLASQKHIENQTAKMAMSSGIKLADTELPSKLRESLGRKDPSI